jgi:hypothetical protein
MGKPVILGGEAPAEDPIEDEASEETSSDFPEVA